MVTSISEPAPLLPLPVDQSVTPPAKPQPAPPSEPQGKCDPRFEPLQPIFMTDEPLDLAGVARCVAALPGVTACQISHGTERANGGNFPPGFHSENLQSLAPELAASADEAASRIQIGEVQNVTLHSAAQSVSIFTRGEVILGVLLGRRGFVPGVRERIAQAVDALAAPTE
jgi:predicted regulator of Ras-like GTPase activity (Roadblock/LC7/MglB family)